jgi:hypothetical protein
VKTYTQLCEDISKRRQQLRQRQLDQMQSHKEKVASYQSSQRQNQAASQEKEQLKKEIKRELQQER